MLKPREHLRARRFADDYVVTGNLGEQTMQAGNSVSSNVAQWLGGYARRTLEGVTNEENCGAALLATKVTVTMSEKAAPLTPTSWTNHEPVLEDMGHFLCVEDRTYSGASRP
jgi:hypothetical protein